MNAGNFLVSALTKNAGCLFLAVLLLLAPAANLHAKSFSASVDRTVIGKNESLTLTLKLDGSASATQPDVSALSRDFRIASQRSNSSMNIINGQRTASVEWVYTLIPKRTGMLVIPSFHSGKLVSDAIPIEVKASAVSSRPQSSLDVTLDVSPEQVYVQQQARLTVRLLSAKSLDGVRIQAPSIENADVLDLGEKNYEKIIDGIRYIVVEHDYALFPQASGELVVPPFEVIVSVRTAPQRGFFFGTPSENYALQTDEMRISVVPKPATADGGPWLPAKKLTLEESWGQDIDQLNPGDSVTRTITLKAEGLHSAQLPEILIAESPGMRVYPESPRLSDSLKGNNVLGTREQALAIVVTEAGELRIPDIRLRWWNTDTEEFAETTLEGRVLHIGDLPPVAGKLRNSLPETAPAAPATRNAVSDDVENEEAKPVSPGRTSLWAHPFWAASSLLLFLLWLATLCFYRYRQKRGPGTGKQAPPQDTKRVDLLFKACLAACRGQGPEITRRCIREWARVRFDLAKEPTVLEIAQLAGDPDLAKSLQQLEEHLYKSNVPDNWNGHLLAKQLEQFNRHYRQGQDNNSDKVELPGLYPPPAS